METRYLLLNPIQSTPSETLNSKKTNKKITMTMKCNQCDYATNVTIGASKLRAHLKSHFGEKSHKCSQCDYSSVWATSLREHLKTHTGEKPHKCSFCDHTSVQASRLCVHLKINTREKSHKCKVCKDTSNCQEKMMKISHSNQTK